MTSRIRLRSGPFVLAIAVAVAVVLSAPFVGQIRDWIRATFPGRFVIVVGALGGLVLLGALAATARRIRQHRARRFAAIGAALSIALAYSLYTAGPNPESNAVERLHFLEYGLIAFLFYRAWRPLGDPAIVLLPALAAVIVGTAEEWFQWFIPRRVGEIRDIYLNLVAVGCGLLFSVAALPPDSFEWRLGPSSLSRICRLAAASVVALAAFVHVLHFGYAVADPEVGRFMSRYSGEQLLEAQAQKADAWRTQPPPLVLQRLSREDQYLSEGIEHVMERNERWAAGQHGLAWAENRILEKYFVPVLETPTYAGKSGHRWPAEQRAEAESKAQGFDTAAYASPAYPYPIVTWNRSLYWTTVGVFVLVLAVVGRTRRQA